MKHTHATETLPGSHTRTPNFTRATTCLDGWLNGVIEVSGFVAQPSFVPASRPGGDRAARGSIRREQTRRESREPISRRFSKSVSDWGVVTAMAVTMLIAVVGGLEFGLEVRQLNIAATISAISVLSLFAVVDEVRSRRHARPQTERRSPV
jgi:hypothetical protein